MSIVRYTNKKTGVVTLYESTSHYDPVTKQSRPIRKYLGIEDPETGELIPSDKKRGRKKGTGSTKKSADVKEKQGPDYQLLYEEEKRTCIEKEKRIRELEKQITIVYGYLERMRETLNTMLENKMT